MWLDDHSAEEHRLTTEADFDDVAAAESTLFDASPALFSELLEKLAHSDEKQICFFCEFESCQCANHGILQRNAVALKASEDPRPSTPPHHTTDMLFS